MKSFLTMLTLDLSIMVTRFFESTIIGLSQMKYYLDLPYVYEWG